MITAHLRPLFCFLTLSLVLFTGCQKEERPQLHEGDLQQKNRFPTAPANASTGKSVIYLVPIAPFPEANAEALRTHLKQNFQLPMQVLPAVKLEESAVDRSRQQLIGEELVRLVQRRCPKQAQDPTAILIGLTDLDIYLRSQPNWRFAFAQSEGGKYTIISSARMDNANLGRPADAALLQSRLRKMVMKHIGLLYYGYAHSKTRDSVMFTPILSVDDLDSVPEKY